MFPCSPVTDRLRPRDIAEARRNLALKFPPSYPSAALHFCLPRGFDLEHQLIQSVATPLVNQSPDSQDALGQGEARREEDVELAPPHVPEDESDIFLRGRPDVPFRRCQLEADPGLGQDLFILFATHQEKNRRKTKIRAADQDDGGIQDKFRLGVAYTSPSLRCERARSPLGRYRSCFLNFGAISTLRPEIADRLCIFSGLKSNLGPPPADLAGSPQSDGCEARLICPKSFRIRRLKDFFGLALIYASKQSQIPKRRNDGGPKRPFLLDVSHALRSLGPR